MDNHRYYIRTNSKLPKLRKLNTFNKKNVFTFLRGGPRGRVIPGSIPNPEVKPLIADNTYPVWIGNVGRCLFDFYLFILLTFKQSQIFINLFYYYLFILHLLYFTLYFIYYLITTFIFYFTTYFFIILNLS